MTKINLEETSERSIEEICSDAEMWCAITNEICRRNGPEGYIEIQINLATDLADLHGSSYWSLMNENIREAEKEASKNGYQKGVVLALIKGYKKLINGYHKSTYYVHARIFNDTYPEEYKRYLDRIEGHEKRIKELEKLLEKN